MSKHFKVVTQIKNILKQTETTKAKENEELQTELNQVRTELKEAKIMIE